MASMSACQQIKVPVIKTPLAPSEKLKTNINHFRISGKIGLRYPDKQGKVKFSSAFYAWAQADKRFAIDLSGALGIGKTHIESDGHITTLTSEKTGHRQASSPEALLKKVSGWKAPISKLPYWVMGKPTPQAADNQYDNQKRLVFSRIHDWQVRLSYKDNQKRPYKLKMQAINADKTPSIYRVIMSIEHHGQTQ